MDILSLRDIDVEGKTVIVRVDYNLPLDENGDVRDHTRIVHTLPTIEHLLKKNAKIVLLSHLGRPNSREERLRMDVVAKRLSELIGKYVEKLDGVTEEYVKERVKNMKPGDIILLENVRFYPEEKEKNEEIRHAFARKIAEMGDIFVNEAFGVSHRDHASITGIPKFILGCCGFGLEKEVRMISQIVQNADRPYIAIVGGKKDDKIKALEILLEKVDRALMGGVIANTFLKVSGFDIGQSKFDEKVVKEAKDVLERFRDKIMLPVDVVVDENGDAKVVDIKDVSGDMKIMDIGPTTIEKFKEALSNAKTVLWAGPLGKFEKSEFEKGTKEIAEFVAELNAKTLVGGGDSVAALEKFNTGKKMTHISTGGGAFMDFVTKEKLPGIEALRESYRIHGHIVEFVKSKEV